MDPLQWLFIILKLTGAITWPWRVVLLPLEIECGFGVLVLLVMVVFGVGLFCRER